MNTESNFQLFKENIWLKKVSINKKGHMDLVNICMQLEDKSFVTIGVLYFQGGVYYAGKDPVGTIDDESFLTHIEKITGIKKPKDSTNINKSTAFKADVSIEEVCEAYRTTRSIKQTAKAVSLSEEKTKKLLISAGLYTSEKHEKIKTLLAQGKTLDEISEELKMSQKQIRIFWPYNKNNG